eukprot:TRINITY_DN9058_c0_g1_i1.p1 TRINITY_DN9058_c0_g1~~TRINITY_DN9058_c0_g1_i1.p1  ORF type:complete len:1044 (+),score=113.36 TRINITY_DN9058_c0_g1_i1:31-3162(+)
MECALCFECYAVSGETCPYSLPCGHTYCYTCLTKLHPLKCPQRCASAGLELSKLTKNFGLIEHMESVMRQPVHVDPHAKMVMDRMKVQIYQLPYSSVVKIKPAWGSTRPRSLPLPVIVLDRSPSMGGALRWIINVAVPEALEQLGYASSNSVKLITFDSTTEVVQVRGRDPTIQNLRNIPVSGRGTRTMMAPAVAELGRTLSQGGAYNVIVVSDGFVDDMDDTKRNAVAAATRVPADSRIAFAMIRFFNGHPPDTVALSMCGALGTTGPAPVVDCEPPAQWECTVCTFLNPTIAKKCEICETPSGGAAGIGKDDGPLHTFIKVFSDAFATQMLDHVKVRGRVSRLPLSSCALTTIEVPVGVESFLQLDSNELVVDGEQCEFQLCSEGEAGLGLSGQLEGELDPYFYAVLAQLRLWLLAGTRSGEFHEIVDLCRSVLNTRSDQAAGGVGLLQRAWVLRKNVERTESTLSRITALASSEQFVQELGSKQQGDFLRNSSVAKSDRLLARRALGPDIIYHDSCRACLESVSIPAARSDTLKSCYGGSTYVDVMRAAKCLAGAAADLSAADILQVVGGFGVPYHAVVGNPEDAWTMTVCALDPMQHLSESDIWAAKTRRSDIQLHTGIQATGVIPLPVCDPVAHMQYMTSLRPVVLLQLGSQLNAQLPVKPWGWANLFSNPAGGPPDHSHALRDGILARAAACLTYAIETYFGSRCASSAETALTEQLVKEVEEQGCNELPNSCPIFLSLVRELSIGDPARAASLLQDSLSHQTILKLVAAIVTARARGARTQSCSLLRALHECCVVLAFKKLGPLSKTQRRNMILDLCCSNYEEKTTPIIPEAVAEALKRHKNCIEGDHDLFGEEHAHIVRCYDEVRPPLDMSMKLGELQWTTSKLSVGLFKVLSVPAGSLAVEARGNDASEVFTGEKNNPGVAYVLASIAVNAIEGGKLISGAVDNVDFAKTYLKRKVAACFREEYDKRLQEQVSARIIEESRSVVELQRNYRAGTEHSNMIDTFSQPDTLMVLRLGRAPWAPSWAYTTTRPPRSF